MTPLVVGWAALEPPRVASAVIASGVSASNLARRVSARDRLSYGLRAATSHDTLIVLGEASALPWVDGAAYLGVEAGLLLPTTLAPSVEPDLLRSALAETWPILELVVTPDQTFAFAKPTGDLDPTWMREWAERLR